MQSDRHRGEFHYIFWQVIAVGNTFQWMCVCLSIKKHGIVEGLQQHPLSGKQKQKKIWKKSNYDSFVPRYRTTTVLLANEMKSHMYL